LTLVFICGLINVVITVTKVRKQIIRAIPLSLQHAIGGGIGIFIFYIGLKDGGLLNFIADPGHWFAIGGGGAVIDSSVVPELTKFATAAPILALIGVVLTVVLLTLKVKGSILIGIILTTLIGIPMGVTNLSSLKGFDFAQFFGSIGTAFNQMFTVTAGAAIKGFGTLFSNAGRLPMVFLAIFAFSLSDTFDTIGTFIGTGRRSGIFSEDDFNALENSKGFKTKMEKALFADSTATSVGALLGTSNTTTYIESAAGIEAGGRTGLTSVFTALFFLLCILLSPVVRVVPAVATAPALIIVGIMMAGSFKEVNWSDFGEAVPAFFAAVLMALAYNISLGIAFGFIFYVIVKVCQRKAKEIHPILWGSTILFVLYFLLMALQSAGII
jgi:AGZA family xanthine/uracil permease-like MFS transporter